jgi:beta-lactamase class D
LFAKTRWAARATPQIGWKVCYVETPDATWNFASNMDTCGTAGLPLRQALAYLILQAAISVVLRMAELVHFAKF